MNNAQFRLKHTKVYIAIVIFSVFIGISVWVIFNSNAPAFGVSSFFAKSAAAISLLFCLIVLYFCFQIVLSKKAGLTINKEGITDNSSALSLGFISWKSVSEARVEKRDNKYLLLARLKNKEKYMKDDSSYIARVMKINLRDYEREIVVRLDRLICKPSEVEEAIKSFFA